MEDGYSSWKVHGRVPTYWFMRTIEDPLLTLPFDICAAVPSILALRYIFFSRWVLKVSSPGVNPKHMFDSSCDLEKIPKRCRSLNLVKRFFEPFQKGRNRRIAREFLFSWVDAPKLTQKNNGQVSNGNIQNPPGWRDPWNTDWFMTG